MTSRTRRAVALPAVLAAAVALPLTGCAGQHAGAAAVVGDRKITVAQVQAAYRDVNPLVGQDAQFTQTNILNWLILEPYLVKEAAREGLGVSGQQAAEEFTKVEGASRHPSAPAVSVVRAILARGAIVQNKSTEALTALSQTFAQELKADNVQISPRFGSGMDLQTAAILPEQPNWLVRPKASPTPAAPTPEP